VAGKNLLY